MTGAPPHGSTAAQGQGAMTISAHAERISERIVLRGGTGPEQPEWDDVETYSVEWYRRFRDWHHAKFPDADVSTRDNLDMFVRQAERKLREVLDGKREVHVNRGRTP